MAKKKDDNKIRVRCTGCGKRIKFPANLPGTTFRCPICKTTLVSPLSAQEIEEPPPMDLDFKSPVDTKFAPPSRTTPPKRAPAQPPHPPRPKEPPPPSIYRLNSFILREQKRVCELSSQVVHDPALSDDRKTAELLTLRHEKAVNLRSFVDAMLRDFKHAIDELRNSPAAETESVHKRIKEIAKQRDEIRVFLKMMYQLRTVGEDNRLNGATTGTPAAAKEPPSKPSPPDAQTPRN